MKLKVRRYYVPDPTQSVLRAFWHRLTRRRVPPFPRTLQIQTVTGCNADCVFCPYGETYRSVPQGRMDENLFRALIEETAKYKVRRISPYLMNEPFIDPQILDRVRIINDINPRAKVVLTTNGGLLTPERVDRLLGLGGGVHELYLSVQGIDPEAYRSTMRGGLRFEKTMAHIDYLLETMKKRGAMRPVVWITMVDSNLIDARAAVAYWAARGVRSKYTRLENRGGNIREAGGFSRSRDMQPFADCTRLMKQAYVLFNGDVVLCCTDYRQTMVLGNIREGGLYRVWNSPRAMKIRSDFVRGDLSDNPLCRSCTVDREVEVTHLPR